MKPLWAQICFAISHVHLDIQQIDLCIVFHVHLVMMACTFLLLILSLGINFMSIYPLLNILSMPLILN